MKKLVVIKNIVIGLVLMITNSRAQTVSYLSSPPNVAHPLDLTKAVGSLPSTVNVNAVGAATYNIPIELPPGTSGMTPQLSLQYNSMAGNGIMGIGWALGGISVISRVGQDRFNEGDYTAVNYTSADRLKMDGQRLILKSGTWFGSGSQYRTQNESFNQVQFNGAYFVVLTPNGDSIYYGLTPESRYKVDDSRVLSWYISKVADAFGNSINYTYRLISGSNELLIDKIEYTKTKTLNAYNKVQFNYETGRTDYMKAYHAGIKFDGDNILKGINIYANGTVIKSLTFRYIRNCSLDASYLSYIENSGKDGIITNTTQFNWVNKPSPGSFPTKEYIMYESSENLTNKDPDYKLSAAFECNKAIQAVLDAGGDGVSDILSLVSVGSNKTLTFRNNGLTSSLSITMPSGYTGFVPIDYDGDGKDELLFHKGITSPNLTGIKLDTKLPYNGVESLNPGNLQFVIKKYSNGAFIDISSSNNYGINGLNSAVYEMLQGDYDGNGMTDLLFLNKSGSSTNYMLFLAEVVSESISFVKRAEGTFTLSGEFNIIDFNGDGKHDLFYNGISGISFNYITKIAGSSNYSFGEWQNISSVNSESSDLTFGDINGDGNFDFLEMPSEDIYISTASAESPRAEKTESPFFPGMTIGADFNGDGRNDPYKIRIDPATNTFYLRYTLVPFDVEIYEQNILTASSGYIHQLLFNNVSVDGSLKAAVISYSDVRKTTKYNYEHAVQSLRVMNLTSNCREMVIGSILDGNNKKIEINYAPKLSANYSMDETPAITEPIRVINPNFLGVYSIKTDDGIGGMTQTTWSYENARIHIGGRGFLGFGKVTAINQTTGIKSESVYTYDNTSFEPLLKSNLVSTTGTPAIRISGSNYGYKYYSYGTGGQKHYIIYPDTTSSYDYLSMFKEKTTFTYTTADLNHGNWSTAVKKYYTIGTTLQENASVTVNNTFESFLGGKFYRLKTNSTNALRPSQTASKTKKNLVYLNGNCTRVNKEIIYYYDPVSGAEDSDKDTVTYNYSALGNTSQVITQLGNIKRTVGYQYDSKERFANITTDPLGYTITTQYDDRGLLLSKKDPNNVTVSNSYDGLGRLVSINNPDASDRTDSIKWVKSGDPIAPQYAVYYHKVIVAGKPYLKTYYDKLGRAIRSVTQAQNNRLIYSDVVYNSKGQQVQSSLPYFPGDTIHWNYTTYYDDGRVQSSYLDNNIKKTTFTYAKNKVTQTMNNTGQIYTKTYDATGALINATDPGGAITYSYYSSGNPKSVIVPGSTTTIEYDKYNKQKKLTDANAGTIEYEYNAYGELKYQKDAKGNWFRITKVDKAGRPLTKTSSEGSQVTYTYDTDFKGALYQVVHTNGTSSQYTHDALGNVTIQNETIQGQLYSTGFTYDSYSNPLKITYPSDFNITYTYTSTGYLSQVKHTNNTIALWSAGDVNALGEWKNFTLGTGLNRQFTYDKWGMPAKIVTNTVQSLQYSFNAETGNLNYRKDVLKNLTETFTYNTTLDQLVSWKVGSTTYNVNYLTDGTNRINTKTDAGTYVYGSSPAIHRVTGINNNPGTINNVASTINYTVFNKIDSIFETGRFRLKFLYGADEQRRVSRLYNSSNVKIKETIYVPGGYEVEKIGTVTRKMHYIPLGDSWALYVKNSGGQDSLYFLLTDHLGSVNVITNAGGTKLKEYSFDPWGRRRNPVDWTYTNVPAVIITTRGFTMHEHMDKFNYINMNGRVYDPVLGQFLSPDPFIGNPGSTQSYNRYAYCNYNPLKYIDPSGYIATIENIIDNLWGSPYGGYWSDGDGAPSYYTSSDVAFMAGYAYNNLHNSWGNTEGGSASSSTRNYFNLVNGQSNLIAKTKNDYTLSWNAGMNFFNKYFDHLELKPVHINNYNSNSNSNLSDDSQFSDTPAGEGDGTLGRLYSINNTAGIGMDVVREFEYNATLGIGTGAGRKWVYYNPSGWTGSNQYVLKTFGVAKSLGYIFFTGGTVLDLTKYFTGQQSGLKTGINMGISTTSLIVGGTGGIAISGGYEYLQYMWNCISGYGESVNKLYRDTYQNYWKGTLLDPQY